MSWCDRLLRMMACNGPKEEEWECCLDVLSSMASALSAAEIFIALVVAAHAAVLALRLSVSLYRA
ncbi:hypothetical protein CREGCYN_06230 [Synechococcus sp. M16CYN]